MTETMYREWISALYTSRHERRSHPEGVFDSKRRWCPSNREDGDRFTRKIRTPSCAWPYSYMLAARTKKHCTRLIQLAMSGRDVPEDVWKCCPARREFIPGTEIGIVRDWVLEGCPALR